MRLEIQATLQQGDFNFTIDTVITRDTVGIFGASGAGKSTLLHLISGLKHADKGRIVLNNRVFADTSKKVFVEPHKRGIGLVFQDGRLFPHMNVEKNLRFGSKRSKNQLLNFTHIVKTLELENLLKRHPGNLSGGERQRVAVGRALLSSPELLLFDEPFSAIDMSMRLELLPFISRINNEYDIPMLMISHDLPELLNLTDHLLIIEGGRLLNQGICNDLIFDDSCMHRLLNSGATSSFNGKVLARNPSGGTARIAVLPQNQNNSTKVIEILGPYNDSISAGEYIRGQLAPQDIMLAAGPVEYISAQNQLRATITRTRILEDRALVELDAGGFRLITEVTIKSNADFLYTVGSKVWVLFKTWAVNYTPYRKSSDSPDLKLIHKSQISQKQQKTRFQEV